MLEWALAIVVFVLLLWTMIAWLKRMKAKPRKRSGGGFVVALGMILASALDPAKAAATEELDRQKNTEDGEEGESGAPPT